jgi:two-component system, chemotaxis family, chemotaxis protein CheV
MSILDHVDATTSLAKSNELQLLVFKVHSEADAPYYAINVFKTREVVEAKHHHLTLLPGVHRLLEGTIVLRGMQIPLLNLPGWLGVKLTPDELKRSNILICDFNGIIIGLRIMYAHRVVKKNWSEMHAPDGYAMGEQGMVINDTRLEDGSICLVLDYEKLLSEIIPAAMVNTEEAARQAMKMDMPQKLRKGTILVAEDSKTAQSHLRQIFDKTHILYKIFDNGQQLMDYIDALEETDGIAAVVTDIEMPEMSGFTVIQELRKDKRTKELPIVVNSSMTGDNNRREATALGADGFIDKTKSKDLLPLIAGIMKERGIA